MIDFEKWLKQTLQQRKNKDTFRELRVSSGLKDFCSNDYLGLAQSEKLFNTISEKIESLNIKINGAAGSRLLSGNSSQTEEIEQKLASIFKSESGLIFNSGYTANLAVLSSIPQKDDTILYDELAHASIKDGARLSLAKRFSFKHNDLNDLEQKIKRSTGKTFIVVESIYSMDGDECLLKDITLLADKYKAVVILDEAHSTGILGENGSGYATSLELQNKIGIRIYTFGKAMGCHGAYVAGSHNLIQYLINFSRPFIYTTAMPPHSIIAIACAFDFIQENIQLQKELNQNINLFLGEAKDLNALIKSKSAIQAVVIPGNKNVREASNILLQEGFDVRPILSPTVQPGSERLRICLHTFNTTEDIKQLVRIIYTIQSKS